MLEKCGSRIIYASDEFYLTAEREIPPYSEYEDFPQIENGVGTTAKFLKEFGDEAHLAENDKKMLLIVGTSACAFIEKMAKVACSYIKGLKAEVLGVENKFFGASVNCTGLLTGGDIADAVLAHGVDFDYLVIPRHVLREGTEVFLDDVTVSWLSERIGAKVLVTDGTGEGFFKTLAGENL